MKPTFVADFLRLMPAEADYRAIESSLSALMQPLGRMPGMRFRVRLRNGLRLLELPDRCVILEKGSWPEGVYFLVYGSVLQGTDFNGNLQLSEILRTGDFILPLKLFSREKSVLEMRTAEPSRLLFMDTPNYQLMMDELPDAGMLTNLWRDEQETLAMARKFELSNMDAVGRMCWMYRKWPDCFRVFADEVIGAYLSLSRETVCRNKKIVMRKNL